MERFSLENNMRINLDNILIYYPSTNTSYNCPTIEFMTSDEFRITWFFNNMIERDTELERLDSLTKCAIVNSNILKKHQSLTGGEK